MKRLAIAAVAALSLSSLAQPAPAPAPAKGTSAPAPAAPAPGKAAPAPAPAGSTTAAPAPATAATAPVATMKMGPASRKPTSESTTRLEINGFFKAHEEAMKSKNFEAALALVDFPVTAITDSASGEPETTVMNREQYIATMKPMWDQMPADHKMMNKLTIAVLSDSLVNVVNDFTEMANKKTSKGRSQELLIKVGGKWKVKVMTEAGWGAMTTSAPAAATPPPAPVKTGTPTAAPAPAKTGAPAPAPAPKH